MQGKALTLFVNHFKSMMSSDYSSTVDGRTRTHATHPQLVNGLPRLPEADRWTHYDHCPVWVDLPIAALT